MIAVGTGADDWDLLPRHRPRTTRSRELHRGAPSVLGRRILGVLRRPHRGLLGWGRAARPGAGGDRRMRARPFSPAEGGRGGGRRPGTAARGILGPAEARGGAGLPPRRAFPRRLCRMRRHDRRERRRLVEGGVPLLQRGSGRDPGIGAPRGPRLVHRDPHLPERRERAGGRPGRRDSNAACWKPTRRFSLPRRIGENPTSRPMCGMLPNLPQTCSGSPTTASPRRPQPTPARFLASRLVKLPGEKLLELGKHLRGVVPGGQELDLGSLAGG